MSKKKSDYVPAPTVEAEMERRYLAVLKVLSGASTVTDAAKDLGLSRNRFQTLMHRGLTALVNELVPKLPGPAPVSDTERALRAENEQLKRHVQRLESRVETVDRMLGMASEMVRGRVKMTGRGPTKERRTAASTSSSGTTKAADPEPERADVAVVRVSELRRMGMRAECAAALAGRSASTLRRWTRRTKLGQSPCRTRGPAPRAADATHSAQASRRVDELVRATHGLIGADALRHAVPGTTRRGCGHVKRETVRAMERERRAECERVVVTKPGVVRGFDQMHVRTTDGPRFLLFSADGAVQYRTSVMQCEHYDGTSVHAAVARDFDKNGPPLVWRVDRAKQHEDPRVLALLEHEKVLLLHGPPRHPQYYAQLERQNREHRAWLDRRGLLAPEQLDREAEAMVDFLNGLWPRRTLDWKTASVVWQEREPVDVDRDELREEVRDRAAKLRRDKHLRGDVAQRFAIEAALTQRQLLQRSAGGWC
jgi:cell division septum initiation protein DivIVA